MSDLLNSGQENSRAQARRAARQGVATCLFGFVLSLASALNANSLAILADLFNSFLGLISITATWLILRPNGEKHRALYNYGLGKIENLASLCFGLFMLISGITMGFLIVHRLAHPVRIHGFGVWLGIVCTLTFGLLNGRLWWQNARHHRQSPSPLSDAQSRLFAVKTFSNVSMFLTFTLSLGLHSNWSLNLDPAASCLTLGFMGFNTWKLVRTSVHDLLDRSLQEPLQLIITRELATSFDAYEELGPVRSRYSGENIFIEIKLGFAPHRTLGEIQGKIDSLRVSIQAAIPKAEVTIIAYATPSLPPTP